MLTASQNFPIELLKDRDYTIILSRSCVSYRVPGLAQCWAEAQEAIQALIQTCSSLDDDGLVLYVASEVAQAGFGFQKYEYVKGDRHPSPLQDSYPPASLDCVGLLGEAIQRYFERRAAGQSKPNGELFLVILDGEPIERQQLTKLVLETAQRLEHPHELAIGLVQIGDDSMAEGLFRVLDEGLEKIGAVHDIVHTQKIETLNSEHLGAFLWDVLND
ncbi:MAG: hypothetical protein HC824_13755 [Synechococcales cyanobacterium RM1_1_8]|nr:hypothetical protein [Synechococcales cyanobacterium RM1_1_8]